MPFLHLDDADIHYETFGEGTPFLFISGTATDGEVWKRHQVPEFSRDHQVIIYDQRSTGKTKTRSQDVSSKGLTDDVAALLGHLGAQKAVVLGHSMGGRIAQLLALDHPDKVGKLILASSGASFPSLRHSDPKNVRNWSRKGYERYLRGTRPGRSVTTEAFITTQPRQGRGIPLRPARQPAAARRISPHRDRPSRNRYVRPPQGH